MVGEHFAPSDRVTVISGGPVMTVEKVTNIQGDIRVRCVWFDDHGERKSSCFAPAALKRYEDPKIPDPPDDDWVR